MNLFKDFFRDCGRRFAQPRSGAHIFIARGPFGGCLSVGGCKLPCGHRICGPGFWQIFRGFILVYGGAFGAVGRGGLVGCVRGRGLGASCLPRFILLGSFSDTLLVVSILDIVYDCYL